MDGIRELQRASFLICIISARFMNEYKRDFSQHSLISIILLF